jgi:phosphohistidine phosphatase
MELYLIRHAEAVRLGERGITTDEDRPLTEEGLAQAGRLGAGLQRRGIRPALILTSPLVRARQTAEQLARELAGPVPEVRICAELAPGFKRRKLARTVETLMEPGPLALIGHQPGLGIWAGWLIGSKKVHLDLPKAGVACIRASGQLYKGTGTLLWLLPPEWLT